MNMTILYTLEKLRTPFLNYLLLGITHAGSEAAAALIVFVLYWCVSKKAGLFVLANCLIGSGCNQIVKLLCHVPRPFVKYGDFSLVEQARSTTGGFSFPSGHTQNVTSLYGSIAVSFRKKWVRICCAVMIALVAFSRLYLGAHYPTDVLGGFGVGLVILLVLTPVYQKAEEHPSLFSVLLGTAGALMIAALLMFEYGPWKAILEGQAEPEVLADMLKGIGICAGCALAAAVSEPIERTYVRFDTHAVWWAQILKTALGMALIAALALVLKYPAEAILGKNSLAYVPRFFVPVVFGMCVWPMTFRWFAGIQSGK
jgi:undecaprenyl-diphosphatase